LAEHWFYPDFVGILDDGRMFVVEYKGADRKSNVDTIEKDAIGRLWASKSDKCLYKTVSINDDGKDIAKQLDELFA
jgi:type III restriction enzyme